ncbi:MAG TPA: PLD nuclease N-terminal domain-containing protein [Dongiaceae bacterium]|nr:PLD nuclease N-terminal domain-containing protein [Dongiaceae bacterium]
MALLFTLLPLFGFALFAFLVVAGMIFWIWMLVDCVTKEPSQGNDKIVWLLVILLTNWLGALIYFFVRRPERRKLFGV